MPNLTLRLCHHCAVPLGEDEVLHYAFECHACILAEHELEAAVRRDPRHPEAGRLRRRAVETWTALASCRPKATPGLRPSRP